MIFDLLKGGAIAGTVVGFWDKIKSALWKIISIVIQRVEISTIEADDALVGYLVNNYKYLRTYDKTYGASSETMRTGNYGLVPYEKYGTSSMLFWCNKKILNLLRPFFLYSKSDEKNKGQGGNYGYNAAAVISTITCIRGTLDIDSIISESAKMRNSLSWQSSEKEKNHNRFDIIYLPNRENRPNANYAKTNTAFAWYKQKHYRLLGLGSDEIGRPLSSNRKALDNLFFPQNVKDLIQDISRWVHSRDWYKEKSIPWKKGWLLYGPPGTGKTALVRAFAEDLNMPIYVFSLSQMSNNDLMDAWKNMQLNIPCIALIEDIDNVFHGRKNITANLHHHTVTTEQSMNNSTGTESKGNNATPLTFDCLLNCLDGVDKSDGVFTIITTNDIAKIDSAIGEPKVSVDGNSEFVSSRPGRIDKAIELTYMEAENKIEMAKNILGEYQQALDKVLEHIGKNEKETPAQFQEYCSQIAIREFWDEKNKTGNSFVKVNGELSTVLFQ